MGGNQLKKDHLDRKEGFGIYSMREGSMVFTLCYEMRTLHPMYLLSEGIFSFSCACLEECNAAIHKKCIDKIIGRCTGTAANSRDTMVRAGTIYLECNYVIKHSRTNKTLYRNSQVHLGGAWLYNPSYCLLLKIVYNV